MKILRWLCEIFPTYRKVFIWTWYALSLPFLLAWAICFPGTAILLYCFDSHPINTRIPRFEPLDVTKGTFLAFCLAVTVAGLVAIYFNVKALRRLRLGISS